MSARVLVVLLALAAWLAASEAWAGGKSLPPPDGGDRRIPIPDPPTLPPKPPVPDPPTLLPPKPPVPDPPTLLPSPPLPPLPPPTPTSLPVVPPVSPPVTQPPVTVQPVQAPREPGLNLSLENQAGRADRVSSNLTLPAVQPPVPALPSSVVDVYLRGTIGGFAAGSDRGSLQSEAARALGSR